MALTRDEKLNELSLQFQSDLDLNDSDWKVGDIPEHYRVTLCHPPRSVLVRWIETLKTPITNKE